MTERSFRLLDRAWSHEMEESQQIVKRERERHFLPIMINYFSQYIKLTLSESAIQKSQKGTKNMGLSFTIHFSTSFGRILYNFIRELRINTFV